MKESDDRNGLDSDQLAPLQRRIRRCSKELSTLSARLASFDAPGLAVDDRINQRHIQRNCICLEVALDEAIKWANTLLGEMPANPVDVSPPSCTATALLAINGLLGGIPTVR